MAETADQMVRARAAMEQVVAGAADQGIVAETTSGVHGDGKGEAAEVDRIVGVGTAEDDGIDRVCIRVDGRRVAPAVADGNDGAR